MTTSFLSKGVDLDNFFFKETSAIDKLFFKSSLVGLGANNVNQLGSYFQGPSSTLISLDNRTNWISLAMGFNHGLYLGGDKVLYASGGNASGQLGINSVSNQSSLIDTGISNVSSIFAGYLYSAAIKNDKSLWMWGSGAGGQLGDGSTNNALVPVQIAGSWKTVSLQRTPPNYLSSYANDIPPTCNISIGIKDDGTLWVWGTNIPSISGSITSLVPTLIDTGAIRWKSVRSDFYSFSAISVDDELWTWGLNKTGVLGFGDYTDRFMPTKVNSSKYKTIAMGSGVLAAIKTDGSLWLAGDNTQRLARNTNDLTINTLSQFVSTPSLDWKMIDFGSFGTAFGLKLNGDLYGWGSNASGMLGFANTTDPALMSSVGLRVMSASNSCLAGIKFN